MDQSAKRIGLINWVVLLLATIGLLLVTRYVSSAAGMLATLLAGFGLLVALMSYFQMSLIEREAVRAAGTGGIEQITRQRIAFCHGAGRTHFPPNVRANNSNAISFLF